MIEFKTLGSDPEFFVLDAKGKPYPATRFSRGDKKAPSPIAEREGFFEQRDNVSFEGNIPPASTKKEFINNVTFLREYFIKKVSRVGYSISPNGVEYFAKRLLQLPEAKEFGCSSVISSWDSRLNYIDNRPTPVLDRVAYRVSGFHIHIGWNFVAGERPPFTKYQMDILIGRIFDLFVTIPSQTIKPEPERIRSYGAYGMIRSKLYGTECRTLSTYFTQKEWLGWVWDQTMKVQDFINGADVVDLTKFLRYNRVMNGLPSFRKMLAEFNNREVFKKFKETKEFANDKKQTYSTYRPAYPDGSPVYNSYTYKDTWTTTSC